MRRDCPPGEPRRMPLKTARRLDRNPTLERILRAVAVRESFTQIAAAFNIIIKGFPEISELDADLGIRSTKVNDSGAVGGGGSNCRG